MFYEQMVLAKKGPLGHVWLAAHWEKKLSKAQIAQTNLKDTCQRIEQPKAPMALRLSGHLLLGIVRIYYKKMDFLYTACNEALVKIKMAFRPGVVDMDESVANLNTITMPETFGDFEIILPEDISVEALPEAEQGMFTLNLAQAGTIDVVPSTPPEEMRDISTSEPFNLSATHGEVSSLGDEYTLLDDKNAAFTPHVEPEYIEGPAPPEVEPEQPGYEIQIGEVPWNQVDTTGSVVEQPDVLAIEAEQLPPAAQMLRKKKYKVDRRTQLSEALIKKTIVDPSPLLRRLDRAPPTRELMEIRSRQLESGFVGLFERPMDERISPILQKLIQRTMHPKDHIDLPEGQVLDDESLPEEQRDRQGAEAEENVIQNLGQEEYENPPPEINVEPIGITFEDEQSINQTAERSTRRSTARTEEEEEEPEQQQPRFNITSRTAAMHQVLTKRFGEGTLLTFSEVFANKKRRAVAVGFFEILNIRAKGCIQVSQQEPYGEIMMTKTASYDSLTSKSRDGNE
eukprot:TRINITY_DN7840_c0_g1_i1.p1 TRINITY_DN7840_c0_g1~~TRINITY_DN7840_c0_g1_i1.p1  ORF type:complete len:512 (-),score=112.76 TRINITY_DN7840_c0_g1_i1:91-1626(-)